MTVMSRWSLVHLLVLVLLSQLLPRPRLPGPGTATLPARSCHQQSARGALASFARTSSTKRASIRITGRTASCAAVGRWASAEFMIPSASTAPLIQRGFINAISVLILVTVDMNATRSLLHMTIADADVVVDAAVAAAKATVAERVVVLRRVLTMRCSSISGKLLGVVRFAPRFLPTATLPIAMSCSPPLAQTGSLT